VNFEEESIECQTVSNKLKGTLESLDILQSKFSKLELKHIKTCSEFKSLKYDHDGLAKDFTQSKITIKTLKKEATELISELQKTAKKKNDIIEDLMKYKADKCSEERDLKIKQKKLNNNNREFVVGGGGSWGKNVVKFSSIELLVEFGGLTIIVE
jgi:chromosome segregation ATPase